MNCIKCGVKMKSVNRYDTCKACRCNTTCEKCGAKYEKMTRKFTSKNLCVVCRPYQRRPRAAKVVGDSE